MLSTKLLKNLNPVQHERGICLSPSLQACYTETVCVVSGSLKETSQSDTGGLRLVARLKATQSPSCLRSVSSMREWQGSVWSHRVQGPASVSWKMNCHNLMAALFILQPHSCEVLGHYIDVLVGFCLCASKHFHKNKAETEERSVTTDSRLTSLVY